MTTGQWQADEVIPGREAEPARRRRWRWLFWAAGPVVLWLGLRGIPLAEVGKVLMRLGAGQALLILLINMGVIGVLTARWWMILRVQGHRISIVKLTGYRLAAFAINYFTPGTHVGGEPLQAYWVSQRHAVPASEAAASVLLDKSLEVLANTTFLVIGLLVLIRLGLLPDLSGAALVGVSLVLLGLPILYLASVRGGRRPISSGMDRLSARWSRLAGAAQFVRQMEGSVGDFCLRSPRGLVLGLAFSGLSWTVLLSEYGLMLRFLGIPLDLSGTVAALTAGRLALLTPLPGALGVLEVSQVLALSALGYQAAEGAGLGLAIRTRDLVFGGVGLALATAWSSRPSPRPGKSSKVTPQT